MAAPQPPFTVAALVAFMRAGDTVAFARLRDEHCTVCRTVAPQGEVACMMACDERRCALRDPAALRAERAWVRAVLGSGLVENPDPPDAVIDGFNRHIAEAGCAMPALTRPAPSAPVRRGFTAPTLRGQLHALLVTVLAELAGDLLHENVSNLSKGETHKRAAEAADLWKRREAERVYLLMAAGLTVPQIVARTGLSRDRVRRALGYKEP